jgi:UDP-glucose 4-epimerase
VAGATERLGEVHRPETHLIPNALLATEGGPALTLFGEDYPTPDGTPIRDYIHVSDLADAHVAALEATSPLEARTGPIGGGATTPVIANLGTSDGFSVRDVLAAAEAIVGRPIPHSVGPRRAGDPSVLVASNARALEVLGWSPRRSTLLEMIGSAWAWRRAHPVGYGD